MMSYISYSVLRFVNTILSFSCTLCRCCLLVYQGFIESCMLDSFEELGLCHAGLCIIKKKSVYYAY